MSKKTSSLKINKIILLSLLFFSLIQIYSPSSMSIDFGSEFITTSIVESRKPLTLMENPQSKTKTNQYLYLGKGERIFGYDAKPKLTKEPENVFHNLAEFVGKEANSTSLQNYLTQYYQKYTLNTDKNSKRITFPVNYSNKKNEISAEEAMAMMIKYIKSYSEKFSKSEMYDYVITLPCFMDYKQRQAYINAAELSGIRLVRLIHDNTAAAIKYFNDKKYGKNKKYFMFYNMGASYTQVSLVSIYSKFQGSKEDLKEEQHIAIVDESYDRNLGGRNFDIILAKIIIKKYFAEVKGVKEVADNLIYPDMIQRVLPYAVKYKEVLSANKEIEIKVNGIEKGANQFETILTRKEFEEASKAELNKVYSPIDKILKRNTEITMDMIEQIELIGGGFRIPAIKDKLLEHIPNEKIGIHLNGDDVIAYGAGIINTEVSGYVSKVNGIKKKIFFENNGHPFNIKVKVESADLKKGEEYCDDEKQGDKLATDCIRKISKGTTIFKKFYKFNSERSISFRHDSNLKISLYQVYDDLDEDETSEFQNRKIISYNIDFIKNKIMKELIRDNPTLVDSKDEIKMKAIFSYDKLGVITLKMELLYKVKYYYTMLKEKSKNNKIEFKYKPEVPKNLTEEDIKGLIDEINNSKEYSPDSKKDLVKILKSGDANKKFKVEDEKKIIFIKDEHIIHSYPLPYTKDEVKQRKIMLAEFDDYEKKNMKFLELQNNFESFIFNKREWMKDEKAVKKFTKENELTEFKESLEKISKWYEKIKEEGEVSPENLREKTKELRKAFKTFEDRIEVYEKRRNSVKYFRSEIKSALKQAKNWKSEKPWIEKFYNEEFIPLTNNLTEWIDTMEKQQEDIPEYETEVLNKKLMDTKLDDLYKKTKEMRNIKRPPIEEKMKDKAEDL